MRRKIPSTAWLTAFESAARHQSYTRAADELALTQSAVCRQVGALEEFLGLRLFRRSSRGVALTDAGQRYQRVVARRLAEVEQDTVDLMSQGSEGAVLELAVVPTFGARWLVPRLAGFQSGHPGVRIHMSAQSRPFLFEDTVFDAAIYAGERMWPGTQGIHFMREVLAAVCKPGLVPRGRKLRAADWSRLPLLQQGTRTHHWRRWFAAQGMRVEGDMSGPRFELFSMSIEAAVHGLGIALVPRVLVQDELARGLLADVGGSFEGGELGYYLVHPEGKADNPALLAFRDWLLQAR
ncbi:MAG: LysR family transcriptional regulator [Burkholderiales bacterium]|nr:LysR family transcriptional regulator [Burkholderiales bacterium]